MQQTFVDCAANFNMLTLPTFARARAMPVSRVLMWLFLVCPFLAVAQEFVQLDPFAQATRGTPDCPAVVPRRYSPAEARVEAHVRVERGTACALAGTCEPGGAYKRDPEINEQVRRAIASDQHFTGTSVWVTTSRKWVTVQGCVRSAAQRKALLALVRRQQNVERVFDELALKR